MSRINKIPASHGPQWLLDGFALLRKAPLALGLLGLIWGGLSALADATGQVWLSLVLMLFGPLLFGGMAYAAREVEQGRTARPAHLLQGLREGKALRFLAMLLPQLAALVVLVALLFVMIGGEQLEQMAGAMETLKANPNNPDPALLQSLPVGAMFAWLVAALVASLVATLFTFIAIPEVMFTDRGGLAAMALSFRTCLRNLGAVLAFMLVFVIVLFMLSIAGNVLIAVLAAVTGRSLAILLGQALLMSVLLPLMGAAIHSAWKHMLGGADAASPSPGPTGIEV